MPTKPITPEDPRTRAKIWQVYRDCFDVAEKKRRWNVRDDIPWDQCNPALDPVVADVVQTFCMVELFLPDYLSKQLPAGAGEQGPGVDAGQLGVRGVQALDGAERLAVEGWAPD